MTRNDLYTILQRCGWETTPIDTLNKIWGRSFDGETEEINTTKSASPTSAVTEQSDHETAEEKVAWLTEILVTKAHDPIFADYWLRLARRNLRLGLPLTTPEPELNP